MALKGSGKIVDELSVARKRPPSQKKTTKKKKEEKDEQEEEEAKAIEEEKDEKDEKIDQPGEVEATSVATKKTLGKGTKKGKKGTKKKANSLDSIARFFNDYGESPHL